MSVTAFVFARGGSRGLPRKNVRLLAGKPLIAHAIEAARCASLVDRVMVSTDDETIADVARAWGAGVPFLRPAALASDTAPEWQAWRHAISHFADAGDPVDVFVSVPPTAPLRSPGDIDACIAELQRTDADLVITVTEAHRHPSFNMVRINDGYATLVLPPAQGLARRQDCPPVFDMTTVAYAARPAFVMRSTSHFEGRVRAVVVPPERAIDIDTELDFAFAEFLLTRERASA